MRSQLSLIADVPERVLRDRAPRRSLPEAVEKVLVSLSSHLPAESLPRFYPACVEISVVKGHAIERALRKAGFTLHDRPIEDSAMRVDLAWRYWRLGWGTP